MKPISKKRYILTIVATILGLIFMLVFNYIIFYKNITEKIKNVGVGNINDLSEKIEHSLLNDIDIVQATAIDLDYMIENDYSIDDIEAFLVYKTQKYSEGEHDLFSSIYGYIDGHFIDGSNWIPDADYEPTTREWYTNAINANGNTALVSPYLDAQTGSIVISVSQMLSDKKSVVSVDISLDNIQALVEKHGYNDLGYTFLINQAGSVVAHSNKSEIGKNYLNDNTMSKLTDYVRSQEDTYFVTKLSKKSKQIISKQLHNDWCVVLVLDRDSFYKDVNQVLLRNILICGIISIAIVFFYINSFLSVRNSIRLQQESNNRIAKTNMNVIQALVRTIDAKDRYTNGHSVRVAEYALKIAKRLGKSLEEQQLIYYAGLLHDVGKIRVPEEIINKPGTLTEDEFEQIKIHSITGFHIMKDIYDDRLIARGIKYHHERYDGNGYPNGLSGDNIPEIARILCVADTYDAMTSDRSYRKALSQDKVRKEIEINKGKQFDPVFADIMLELIDEDVNYTMRENASHEKTILVIDDEPMHIKVVKHFLKDDAMCNLLVAYNANEAMDILAQNTVHLILLDIEMPDINGYEALKLIRSKYDIPIVFMTAKKDIDTVNKTQELGVSDYITKPFSKLAIKEIIHSMLNE